MQLITKAIEAKLRRNHAKTAICRTRVHDDEYDHMPVLKLFSPWGANTWLITEIADDGDTMFGLCDLGMGSPELGYVSLSELKSVRGLFGLGIERDLHFKADMTISQYAAEARAKGRIAA